MGGDVVVGEESSSCSCCSSDNLGFKDENINEADLRIIEKSYQEILQSHTLLQDRVKDTKRKLKHARLQLLSYTPGSWAGVKLSDYDGVPKMTSIIIVGPKGAGKSSLVNKITRVIEDDEFAPARAQESYGSHSDRGTFFVEEFTIPRGGSASFCLYDTRGLNQNSSSDNTCMIEQWITRGVCHGEPIIWKSDSSDLKDRLIRDSGTGCEIRKVNSVIFVVNAVEILQSMESATNYAHTVSTAFNCPLLSFKDDKPAVVITHGDVLSMEERARVHVFLGDILSIPPVKQIFDIPERRDVATALTICDLLRYSLEHADKNLHFLPKKKFTISKVVGGAIRRNNMLKFMILLALPLFLAFSFNYIRGRDQNIADEAQHKPPIFRPPSRSLYNLTRKDQHRRAERISGPRPPLYICRWPIHSDVPNVEHKSMPEGEPRIDSQAQGTKDQRISKRPKKEGLSLNDVPIHGDVPNLNPAYVTDGKPSIDSRIAQRLWYDERKVAEAEPRLDRRTIRRLWYVE